MKYQNLWFVFAGLSFALGCFPIIEFILSIYGMSTCGDDGIGCKVIGTLTPFGAQPFIILGALFGFALGTATMLRSRMLVPAILLSGVTLEGILLAFQFNAGFFCRFCLFYGGGITILFLFYIALSPRTLALFSAPFLVGFGSIFLLYFNISTVYIEKTPILEQAFDPSDSGHFYIFYSNSCSHCKQALDLLKDNTDKLKGVFHLAVIDGGFGHAEAAKRAFGSTIFEKAISGTAEYVKATPETVSECVAAKKYVVKHGIPETPTMVVVDGNNWNTIVQGTGNILTYLALRFHTDFSPL